MHASLPSALLVVCGALLAIAPATAQQKFTPEQVAQQRKMYQQAEAEFTDENFAAAEVTVRKLMRLRPTDPYVRQLMLKIQAAKRTAAKRSPWERSLRKMVLPEVNIDDATLEEVTAYVKKKAQDMSEGKSAPAFVFKSDAVRDRTVTMQLKNVPLSEVLRYAGELADVRFSYERYAIVGYDKRAGADAPDLDPGGDRGAPGVFGLQAPVIRHLTEESPGR